MQQTFLYLMGPDRELALLTRRLADAGFQVGPSGRMAGGIHVRIREDSADGAEVENIATLCAPSVRYGPEGAPSATVIDYREGR